MTKAQSSAEDLVFDLELTLPINPTEVCKQLSTNSFSVEYEEREMSSEFCGISVGDRTGVSILVNSRISDAGRKIFTAAHEIGHAVLHIQTGQESRFQCSDDDIYGSAGRNNEHEKDANEFASVLLMPASIIQKPILANDISWRLIQDIKANCGTSLVATARRIVNLSNETCALVIHKDGGMWFPFKSPSFNFFIPTTAFPSHLETAIDDIDTELPDYLNECDASDWFDNTKLPEIIQYSSIRNEEHDRTMSLILIPDIDDDEDDVPEWEEPRFK